MAERNGVISLQSFLHKYFAKAGIDEDEFMRYYHIGADGLRYLNIHHMPLVKATVLSVDADDGTADFPDDFIDYVMVGVELDGRWWSFTRDDDMVDKTLTGVDGYDLGTLGHLSGYGAVGGENLWYFKPDYKGRRFLFTGVTTSNTVVLKYKSTGVNVAAYDSTDDVEFPVYAEESMEEYIRWRVSEYNDQAPMSEKQHRKRLFDESLGYLRDINSPSIDEIRDIWLANTNQTFIRS